MAAADTPKGAAGTVFAASAALAQYEGREVRHEQDCEYGDGRATQRQAALRSTVSPTIHRRGGTLPLRAVKSHFRPLPLRHPPNAMGGAPKSNGRCHMKIVPGCGDSARDALEALHRRDATSPRAAVILRPARAESVPVSGG